jgi:hypothetical protein
MNRSIPLIVALATSTGALAFTNEAVRTVNGAVVVELPRTPQLFSTREVEIRDPWRSGVLYPAYVIQTSAAGWSECPQPWVDRTCRPYQKGRDKRLRAFVLKTGGQWVGCPRPDSLQRCRPLVKGPFMDLQD